MADRSIEQIVDWQGIVTRAQEISSTRMRTVAVAAATDGAVLQAVVDARAQGIANPVLVGDPVEIQKLSDTLGLTIGGFHIESAPDAETAAARAADLASSGEADVIMKGFLPTSTLLKAVLAKTRRVP